MLHVSDCKDAHTQTHFHTLLTLLLLVLIVFNKNIYQNKRRAEASQQIPQTNIYEVQSTTVRMNFIKK